jgi:hypothetical protein
MEDLSEVAAALVQVAADGVPPMPLAKHLALVEVPPCRCN